MPETPSSIHLSQARGIRIVCACGADATVPVGAVNAPAQCFNCGKAWPAHGVQELVGMLQWVKQASANGKISVDLLLIDDGKQSASRHASAASSLF